MPQDRTESLPELGTLAVSATKVAGPVALSAPVCKRMSGLSRDKGSCPSGRPFLEQVRRLKPLAQTVRGKLTNKDVDRHTRLNNGLQGGRCPPSVGMRSALCVVQGSEDQSGRERAGERVGQPYQHAGPSISAAWIPNCRQSFLGRRHGATRSPPGPYSTHPPRPGHPSLRRSGRIARRVFGGRKPPSVARTG